MAYDPTLAARCRAWLPQDGTTSEKAMFGGLAFLQGGAMFAGVVRDRLRVRTGLDGHTAALAEPHVRPMDFTGKALRGYVYVLQDGLATDAELDLWLAVGGTTVAALAAKPARKPSVTTAPADQVWRDLGLAASDSSRWTTSARRRTPNSRNCTAWGRGPSGRSGRGSAA